jgi:hypothetical protein
MTFPVELPLGLIFDEATFVVKASFGVSNLGVLG